MIQLGTLAIWPQAVCFILISVSSAIVDAVFSYGRSGSVSGNVVDAIINVIVIIVFFFLFGVDIKDVYKFLF